MPTGSGDLEIMAFGRLLPGRLRPIYLTSHSHHKSPKQAADLKEVAGKKEGFWEQRCDEMGTELKITPRFISPCSLAVFLMHRKKTCFISKSIVTTGKRRLTEAQDHFKEEFHCLKLFQIP